MARIFNACHQLRLQVFLVLAAVFLLHPSHLFGATKGSETVVSVEAAYTFPTADSDNKAVAFGWFNSGFTLEDASTSCTFDSIFPVGGPLVLNGGTLYLTSDIYLYST